jgi:hypothetical protein
MDGQQFASGLQPGALLQNPFAPNQLIQNPFAQGQFFAHPYLQGQSFPFIPNPLAAAGYAGAQSPLQQVVPILRQFAHQILVQCAVGQQIGASLQQIGIALQQLAHQLQIQSLHAHEGLGLGTPPFGLNPGQSLGLGAGQPLGPGGFSGALGAQSFAQNPFVNPGQGGYGAPGPQTQNWGSVNRPQTIQ